ncbi:ABC transporter substrate-binding protein [Bosea vaviloviae]|uniref:ABC transporter substrate-binding protein n=1 Tax=Bosea vaviloviae TaxID=1526658 RepID=A0A1D7U5E4_9HYPH|nr:ABC transporter substrate-binding protein [Bosea vaviloviae]AOO82587.1 ABC transporter substrate-binding protein [Bosea vaviloviae]
MTSKTMIPSRRDLLQLAGGAAAGAMLAPALIGRADAATQITVADPGGPFGPAFRKAFYDPFEKATGNKVVNVAREAEPTAQFKAMVETKSYTWDVCTLTLSARDILASQNLLDPIGFSHADVPQLMPEAISDNFMGTDVYSTVLAYRTDRVKNAPTSWADFFNIEKFPGRRALRKNPIDSIEQALLADGVPLDKLYPLDIERAFKVLDKIKPHIAVWWTGGAQSTQLLQSGEVDMIPGWNARFQAAIDGGTPAKIVWNQGLYSIEGWAMPKGGPRAEAARQFIKFCSSPQAQAVYTEILAYGPTNLDAYKTIPAERAKSLPTAPDNLKLMAIANEGWWSANRAAVTERFNAWLLI